MRLRKIIEKGRNALIVGSALLTLANQTYAGTFGKIGGYLDSRGTSNVVFTGGAYGLPLGTSLFGFVDAETEKDNGDNLKKPYSEISLSKKGQNGLGTAVEYNRDFSFDNGTTRVGLVYEPNILKNGFIGSRFYPVSTNNNGMQLVLYGSKSFNREDFSFDGFFDYNFKPKKIVTELQFGKKVRNNLYGVIEGRYNGFKKGNEKGVGVGLEWKL